MCLICIVYDCIVFFGKKFNVTLTPDPRAVGTRWYRFIINITTAEDVENLHLCFIGMVTGRLL